MRLLDGLCPTRAAQTAAGAAAGAFVALALGAAMPTAHAQTGLLNDTGQTSCYNASNAAVACDAATAGSAGTRPHQDGRYGRDAAAVASQLTKTGGGAAGFDFTRICWNGAAEGSAQCTGTLVANTGAMASTAAATAWACTQDHTTGLVWSLQTQTASWHTATGASYADTGHNSASRCGYATGWRLPTRRELLSMVHNGLSSGPVVDAAYFPATQTEWYLTADPYASDPTKAWLVNFSLGYTGADAKAADFRVRLVRNAGTPVIDTTAPTKTAENLDELEFSDNAGSGTVTFSENVTVVSYHMVKTGTTNTSTANSATAMGNVVTFTFTTGNSGTAHIEVVVRDAAGNEVTVQTNTYSM